MPVPGTYASEKELLSQVARVLLNESKTKVHSRRRDGFDGGADLFVSYPYHFLHDGILTTGYIVLATKETIVCCGAIDTPKLLLLSGIGPKAHLSEVGVECHVDLAGVGSNLRDHPPNILLYKTKVNLQPDIRTLVLSFFRDEELLRSEEASSHPQKNAFFISADYRNVRGSLSIQLPPGAPSF